MTFENFITRVDEEIIQEIIGRSAIKILNILDTDVNRLSKLQKVLLEIYSPMYLLQDKKIRDLLIDVLKPQEAKELCKMLNISDPPDYY